MVFATFLGLSFLLLPLFSLTRALPAHVRLAGFTLTNPLAPTTASALPSDTLNFQARLASSNGAIVPDGYYNIDFKLYSASTGGTALWSESHAYNSGSGQCSGAPLGVNDCRIRVVNGYVSVYLGSVTSFPTTIPWDQQLFLTMNVGGTTGSGTITYDGEMTPRLKLTAVPYAMAAKNAEQVIRSSGANTATLSIDAPVSGNQTFVLQDQGAAGTYNILTDANAPVLLSGSFIQNQNTAAQTADYWISGAARVDTALVTPVIRPGADGTSALQIQNAAGTTTVMNVDTTNGAITLKPIDTNGATITTNVALTIKNAAGQANIEFRASDNVKNTFIGLNSGAVNTTGINNTALGSNALAANTTGSDNAAIGYNALLGNTTGAGNVAVGSLSLLNNQTGGFNIAVGYQAVRDNVSGGSNIGIGFSSLVSVTGSGNTSVGDRSATSIVSGSNNLILGSAAGSTDFGTWYNGKFNTLAGVQNSTAIGYYAQVTQNDSIVLGSVDRGTKVGIGISSPGNLFSVSPVNLKDVTITATQSGSTVTSSAAIFSAANVGEVLVWADDGTTATITGYTDSTHVTVSTAVTKATATYFRTHKVGLQVSSNGSVGIGTLTPSASHVLDVTGAVRTTGTIAVNASTQSGTVSIQGGLTAVALSSPTAPTLATAGTAGTTSYSYAVSALDGAGETLASTAATIATGNATLDGTNYIRVTWTKIIGATSYKIYRTASGGTPATTGLIGTVASTTTDTKQTFDDTGLVGTGAVPASNTTGSISAAGKLQGGTLTVGSAGQFTVDSSGNVNTSGKVTAYNGFSFYGWWPVLRPSANHVLLGAIGTDGNVSTGIDFSNRGSTAYAVENNEFHFMPNQAAVITANISQERATLFDAPKYTGAFTITDAATVAISGIPTTTGGATITNAYSLWTQAGTVRVDTGTASTVGQVIRGAASQSADLMQLQNNAGTAVATFGANGNLTLGTSSATNGAVIFKNSANANTVTLQSSAQSGNYTLNIPVLGASDTLCLVTLANCAASAASFIQNQNTSAQTANSWINGTARADTAVYAPAFDTASAAALTFGTTNATSITIGKSTIGTVLGSSTITLGTSGTDTLVQGAAQTTANTAGNNLTIQGSTGNGTGVGGDVIIKGGTGATQGLVNISTTAFATTSTLTLSSTTTLNALLAGAVDNYSSVRVSASGTGYTLTVDAPTTATVGRLLYLSNVGATNDFNILLSGTSINIALKPNSTATLIWNGNGWTAAGASSSTDLQSAYNNTLTSAGGAELVLNASGGAADGLTIRNNGTTPISGGLLEIQSSIGTNLFSVNSYGTELVANGGAETAGVSATTFPANTWTAQGSSTVSRTITANEFSTGQAAVKVVTTATTNQGVYNQLTGNPDNSGTSTYQVSFTMYTSVAFNGTTSKIEIVYTPDGGTTLVPCSTTSYGANGQAISAATWTKVTCSVSPTVASVTSPRLIIRQTDATARTIFIDNLSFVRNDLTTRPANVQIGGGTTGGQVTLFTLDRSSSAPLVSGGDSRYLGSMYYDTTLGNLQCYEADGWGACGSAPDNIVSLTPEYTGAVLNGTGVGTMTADFCGNGGGLSVNTSFCASGEARNYYRWTSPQPSTQPYSIFVTYRLPSTFKSFMAGTTTMTGLTDNASNATMSYSIYRKTTSGVTQCSAAAPVVGTGAPNTGTNTWFAVGATTDPANCTFAPGDSVIFQITMSAKAGASVYAENLTFRYSNN